VIELLLAAALAAEASQCSLSEADRVANRSLDFNAFDQHGALPSSARALASRGCFGDAAEANIDYLVHGPDLPDYERNVVRFHTGQYLASSGQEKEAALVIASTRRGPNPERPNFDWDSYVVGTYAFLVKDRPLLNEMAEKLSASDDDGSRINAKVLRRFQHCFDQPYRIAYGTDPRCGALDEPAGGR
jgi:hypothetical protein